MREFSGISTSIAIESVVLVSLVFPNSVDFVFTVSPEAPKVGFQE